MADLEFAFGYRNQTGERIRGGEDHAAVVDFFQSAAAANSAVERHELRGDIDSQQVACSRDSCSARKDRAAATVQRKGLRQRKGQGQGERARTAGIIEGHAFMQGDNRAVERVAGAADLNGAELRPGRIVVCVL